MREKPDLPDQAILNALGEHYALSARELNFLPIGNDASSYVYKAVSGTRQAFFLKVKPGPVYEPAVQVPRFLRDQGLIQVVAPLPTRAGQLFARVGPFSLILYPFIQGRTGMEQGMSPAQWVEFGAVLRRIHATRLPAGLNSLVRREDFRPVWGGQVQEYAAIERLAQAGHSHALKTPYQLALAAFWAQKEVEIQRIVARCARLAEMLRARSLAGVLCHTDIHTANVLLDPQGSLYLIDWDQPKLAPREHDLFFIGGSLAGSPTASPEESSFLQGYGLPPIDPLAMTFYYYVWAVQEIGDYATRVFDSPALGEETQIESVREFKRLFEPGNVIPAAYQVDRALFPAGLTLPPPAAG